MLAPFAVRGGLEPDLLDEVTYWIESGYWPAADEDPAAPPVVVEYARIWRSTRKFVSSTTLQEAAWDTTIVRSVGPDETARLVQWPTWFRRSEPDHPLPKKFEISCACTVAPVASRSAGRRR